MGPAESSVASDGSSAEKQLCRERHREPVRGSGSRYVSQSAGDPVNCTRGSGEPLATVYAQMTLLYADPRTSFAASI